MKKESDPNLFSEILDFLEPEISTQDPSTQITARITPNKKGGITLSYESPYKPHEKERDRVKQEINLPATLDFSGIKTNSTDLPWESDLEEIDPQTVKSRIFQQNLHTCSTYVEEVLQAIYDDAKALLKIHNHRKEYLRSSWEKAVKLFKPCFKGKIDFSEFEKTKKLAYELHLTNLNTYEINRITNNRAPVPRKIADLNRMEQAAALDLPFELDGRTIIAKDAWKDVEQKVQNAHKSGKAGIVFASTALAAGDYAGLEIPCLVTLIEQIRKITGGGIHEELTSYFVTPKDFLKNLGFPWEEMNDKDRQRKKKLVKEALTALSNKHITASGEKGGGATMRGFRSGYFTFEEISAQVGPYEAGSWKFTSLDLLQILSKDDQPFRSIPTDPFKYIVQEADPREYGDLSRLVWRLVFYPASGHRKEISLPLSEYNLASGAGIPSALAEKKQRLVLEAVRLSGDGTARVEGRKIYFVPTSKESTTPKISTSDSSNMGKKLTKK